MVSLKKILQSRKTTIGSWITLGHHSIPEIMSRAGFDWLTVDMEHSAISINEAQQIIQIVELCGVFPLVRVGKNDPTLIKRVMDSGAHGVIVPMVNSKKDAETAVNAVKYPPSGTRGVGLARAQGYGAFFKKYVDWVERESVVVVQIEHIKAVENLRQILKVEGVDAFIVGPYDLSGSLGIPGNFTDVRMIEALDEIKKVSAEFEVSPGYHVVQPEPAQVKEKINEGYTFIAYGVDFLFLGESCRKGLNQIRKDLQQ